MSREKTKRCGTCGEWKILKNNFRVVNPINGYTSKTCIDCESRKVKNPTKEVKKQEGYLYLLIDNCFPEYIKIGYTIDHVRRLVDYNRQKPFDTCSYIYVSKALLNVFKLEQSILSAMYMKTAPTPDRNEWFSIEWKDKLLKLIKVAEDKASFTKE